ncbi:ParB N-terminal domain-containing protein [Desulfohalobiaceae bacterium Ax17]|uniref:ParB N-terminal domain-containing protein n=1 Tax=Desulfovulcanus ferrireducens TaxID=2831190 RepID=UPI00207BA3BD|nr:ParB N-terminal domain-containing protein [Desulfovulcanus ferrireducens]MBT8763051.1 ParB N-terminal domain-containing protein [Desulfovulcanus ferrireducens]
MKKNTYNQLQITNYELLDCDGPWLFWSSEPDKLFIESINKWGQLQPVLVTKVENSGPERYRYELIAGYRRVQALKNLNRPVLIMEIELASDLDKGMVYLSSNLNQTLDPKKQLKALRYFQGLNSSLKELCRLLNIPIKSKQYILWENWLKLPPKWDQLLITDHVPLSAASILSRFEQKDLDAIYPFLARVSWSQNNALHFLTWLWESGQMRGISVRELIAKNNLTALLDRELSPKDLVKNLVLKAWEIRYPTLSELKQSVDKRCQELCAGTKWRVEHKDNFENFSLELAIKINSREELLNGLKDLQQISKSPTWEMLDRCWQIKD